MRIRAMPALLATAALVAVSAGTGAASRTSEPRTLVLAKGPIAAFAQDGGRIAWASIETERRCFSIVRIRVLARGFQDAVNGRSGPTCRHAIGFEVGRTELVLAGDRALWTMREAGNFTYVRVMTGALSETSDVLLQELVFDNGLGDGDHLGGMAGDGSTLLYGTVDVGIEGPPDCELDGTCTAVVAGGGLTRVRDRPARSRVPSAPPPEALAAAGGRVAFAVAGVAGLRIGPARTPRIEVRDVASGNLVGAFELPGRRLRALALSRTFVAALTSVPTSQGRAVQIERYSHRGTFLGASRVAEAASPDLSAAGPRVVYRVGRSVRLLDTASGDTAEVARTAATPLGLTIEGRRVAWAENVRIGGKTRGRIRAVTVT